jgi:hypothetical protein
VTLSRKRQNTTSQSCQWQSDGSKNRGSLLPPGEGNKKEINNLLSNIPSIPLALNQKRGCGYSSSARGLDRDTFVKTSDVSFTGRKGSGSTKRGEPLKELDNITCPYSGIKMITTKMLLAYISIKSYN